MWYDNGIKAYADINYSINNYYCNKWSYTIFKSDKITYTDGRTRHWEKLPMILRHMPSYDYVVWIDSDAHFYIDSPRLESLISKHPDKQIIISGDYKQRNPWELNSGFMIIKCDRTSENIIRDWAYNYRYKLNSKFPYWEQGILWYMYSLNLLKIREFCNVIPYGILQHFYAKDLVTFGVNPYTGTNKPFVRHCAGMSASERICISKNYYEQNLEIINGKLI